LLPVSSSKLLDAHLLDRLIEISAAGTPNPNIPVKQTLLCVDGIFECCSKSTSFWAAFCAHPAIPDLLGNLLLHDSRPQVRAFTATLVKEKIAKQPR
jgi:ubiquitin carboxyl-terminal hydrolase 34